MHKKLIIGVVAVAALFFLTTKDILALIMVEKTSYTAVDATMSLFIRVGDKIITSGAAGLGFIDQSSIGSVQVYPMWSVGLAITLLSTFLLCLFKNHISEFKGCAD